MTLPATLVTNFASYNGLSTEDAEDVLRLMAADLPGGYGD